jgi:DNA-binding NarL/FixJ family response regulator
MDYGPEIDSILSKLIVIPEDGFRKYTVEHPSISPEKEVFLNLIKLVKQLQRSMQPQDREENRKLRRIASAINNNLTPMETRVYLLAVDGMSNKDIAEATYTSPYTVKAHLSEIRRKFGVKTTKELIAQV